MLLLVCFVLIALIFLFSLPSPPPFRCGDAPYSLCSFLFFTSHHSTSSLFQLRVLVSRLDVTRYSTQFPAIPQIISNVVYSPARGTGTPNRHFFYPLLPAIGHPHTHTPLRCLLGCSFSMLLYLLFLVYRTWDGITGMDGQCIH